LRAAVSGRNRHTPCLRAIASASPIYSIALGAWAKRIVSLDLLTSCKSGRLVPHSLTFI
jgi:hypothetical protein